MLVVSEIHLPLRWLLRICSDHWGLRTGRSLAHAAASTLQVQIDEVWCLGMIQKLVNFTRVMVISCYFKPSTLGEIPSFEVSCMAFGYHIFGKHHLEKHGQWDPCAAQELCQLLQTRCGKTKGDSLNTWLVILILFDQSGCFSFSPHLMHKLACWFQLFGSLNPEDRWWSDDFS